MQRRQGQIYTFLTWINSGTKKTKTKAGLREDMKISLVIKMLNERTER